ncbi:MAG TPA: Ig-like domain-containing protein, partial [Luteolibacter sp.]
MKTPALGLFKSLAIGAAAVVPLTASATPAYNWNLQTYYPHAEALPAGLTTPQATSLNQFDASYPLSMTNSNGAGLTTAELNEALAMPAYYNLSRNPSTGVLTGRGIVVDLESSPAQPDLSQPASFNGDFVSSMIRLTDLYARASTTQAPQLEAVYSDLIEHFLDQNYLPGGKNFSSIIPLGNGYTWAGRGWKTLRMMHKLSAEKRDLFAMSFSYVSGFSNLLNDQAIAYTDHYINYYATANQSLALMSDTPAKWQLMRLVRRGMDITIMGKEANPKDQLLPLDGSFIHHGGHHVSYAVYSYDEMLLMFNKWTAAGFTSSFTDPAINRMRRSALAWCFASTGGLMPIHQNMRAQLQAGSSIGDGGTGVGPDFAKRVAELTSNFKKTPIANDLEMAYAAIAKAGAGSTSLPVEWQGITIPSNIDSNSPLYTASLMGNFSHTTNGTAIQRGSGQWYVSLRGQPSHWRGGEGYDAMGLPDHFNLKTLHGSLMLITTGKNGRKPNEVDSGYRYDGWNYSYYPNVTCSDYTPGGLLYYRTPAYFEGESNLMGSANLRESGVWMAKGTACKSAFFLGNRIVLVTNNITGNSLHTGLIQMAHSTPASEPLVLDGTSRTTDGNWSMAADGNHKIVDGQGNGYFVHGVAGTPGIQARRGNQDWTYALADKWTGTGTAPTFTYASDFIARMGEFSPTTANYSRVWFDHGATASNQALEYTVLVKPQAGELDAYATAMANPATAPVTVTKTSKIHRYQDRATGTRAVAVFDATEAVQVGAITTVNRPGAYIWRTDGDLLRLSVSSSQTENTTPFQVSLAGEWTLDSQEDTDTTPGKVTATPNAGNTVVSLSYRQAAPQRVVLRRVMPQVALTAPAANSTFNAPVSQTVSAAVTSHGHGIAKVQFFDGAALIGEDAT